MDHRHTLERELRAAVQGSRDDQQHGRHHGSRNDPQDGAELVTVAAGGDREHHEMDRAHDRVREGEDQAVCAEGVRRRERGDEHRRDGRENGQAHDALFGIERVR